MGRNGQASRENIVAALQVLGSATYAQLADHIGCRSALVSSKVPALVRDGVLIVAGTGDRENGTNGRKPRLYALAPAQPAPTPIVRPKASAPPVGPQHLSVARTRTLILKAVAENPRALTEDRVAQLPELQAATADTVSGALLDLFADRSIVLLKDGTYATPVAARAAA